MAKALGALILALCFAVPALAAAPPQPKSPKPDWSELTPAQQQVLAPLKDDWHRLDTTRRKKWVTVANRYPKMKPAEQQRLQQRMKDWAKLTPEQRRVARDKYRAINKLAPGEREKIRAKWEQYQRSLAKSAEESAQDAGSASQDAGSTQSAGAPDAGSPRPQ